jgi:Zn-dependent protease
MGIPFGINWSWFIIFIFLAVVLAVSYFPYRHSDWSAPVYWVVGISTSLLFFASVLVHEVAHSMVAVRRGIEVKSISLFILGGVARITREASHPSTELLMAVAGPLSSLALGGVFAVIWLAGRNTVEPLGAMAFYLCWINVALAVFNLLPSFPMDGGRVLRSAIWWRSGDFMRATRIASVIGQVLGVVAVLSGVAVASTIGVISGLWAVMIGLFVAVASRTSYRQEVLRDNLRSFTARDAMALDSPRASAQVPVEAALNDYFGSPDQSYLLIEEHGRPAGVVIPKQLKRVPKERKHTATVADVMSPLGEIGTVSPGDDALVTLEKIEDGDLGLVLVMAGDELIGIVDRDRLLDHGFDRPGHE